MLGSPAIAGDGRTGVMTREINTNVERVYIGFLFGFSVIAVNPEILMAIGV